MSLDRCVACGEVLRIGHSCDPAKIERIEKGRKARGKAMEEGWSYSPPYWVRISQGFFIRDLEDNRE